MVNPTVASPVFTVCHKVISLVYSLFQYIIDDIIKLDWPLWLTLKAPITTAADDTFCDIFPNF